MHHYNGRCVICRRHQAGGSNPWENSCGLGSDGSCGALIALQGYFRPPFGGEYRSASSLGHGKGVLHSSDGPVGSGKPRAGSVWGLGVAVHLRRGATVIIFSLFAHCG